MKYTSGYSLYRPFRIFLSENKILKFNYKRYGQSDSKPKNKFIKDEKKLEVPLKNAASVKHVVDNSLTNDQFNPNSDGSIHTKTEVSLPILENKETINIFQAHETIVHKYSPIPSLPNVLYSKISIDIPSEPDSETISPIQRYFLGRFSKYLVKFQQSLRNEMPDTFHILNTFTNGFKEFVIDFRDYMGVVIKMSLPFYDLEDLSRRELELHFNMPRQMIQVFPVVAISSLPFAQNIALPIAYMFPKYLLCYQFWDKKQRAEFPLINLRKRLFNARPVFRSLQTRIDEVEDAVLKRKCQSIFFSLGSGVHPTPEQILEIKKLFSDDPYHLNFLWAQHVNGLLRLHSRSALFRRRFRLKEHARYLHCLDKAIINEGLEMLNSEQLSNMLIVRGINPSGMSTIAKRDFLDKWIYLSSKIDENDYSLLLHLPLFLAYNHPTNLLLLYS